MKAIDVENVGYKILVVGHVQGVGFRYFTAQEARKLGLTGHAKNLKDGSVEVLAFGSESALDFLLNWLKKGPKTSTVIDLNIRKINYTEKKGFLCL